MSVKLGVAPIAWSNDDMPELGGDTSLEQCLDEASQAGYIGIESGGKFPKKSSELLPKGGKHSSYITKKVVLENTSTSVKVLFDGIRNSSNEFKVFVKTKKDSDPGDFDDMNYIEIPTVNYPSSETKSQYRAFDFEIKDLSEFKEFSVKIAMIGNDQSDIPKIRNVRCLALAI